jgi:hypothetical protein
MDCEKAIKEGTTATVRVIPFGKEIKGKCSRCGREAKYLAYFAKSY